MKLADDGFGNLVPASNPFGNSVQVFARLGDRLARFEAGTSDPAAAIEAVRTELVRSHGDMRLTKTRWKCGPVLALVQQEVSHA